MTLSIIPMLTAEQQTLAQLRHEAEENDRALMVELARQRDLSFLTQRERVALHATETKRELEWEI